MIAMFVNVQEPVTLGVTGRTVSGRLTAEELGLAPIEQDGTIRFFEPFNRTNVQMRTEGLIGISIVVSAHRVHVIGNYSIDKLCDLCCATLCGTTVCGRSACVEFGATTVRC